MSSPKASGPWFPAESAPPRTARRRFDGAIVDRLTASWLATGDAIDKELRGDLDRLRARSRDLCKNNEYGRKFMRMVRNNVVGAQGFVLQCQAADPSGKTDQAACTAIENAWYRQCRPGNFEVTGKLSGDDSMRLLIETVAQDGELLYRKVRGRGAGEFGYQIQLLNTSRLDTSYNVAATSTSNAVVMGVEKDRYSRPVAYHILTSTGDLQRKRERIPANEIVHQFVPIEIEQTRGVPWMHASMRLMNDLKGYREAAVIAARIGASKMGIYTSPDGSAPPNDGEDADGNFIQQASPGEFSVAPAGYGFETFDPAYPHDQFDTFCKATLRGIASGIGVAYHGLANDLTDVNYSSIRSGSLEEREEWLVIQGWLISAVLVPMFEDWLQSALLVGIKLPNGSALPPAKLEKFLPHTWQGRRWQWVDPMKDIQAAVIAIENGLASPQQIAAQSGRDVVDIIDDIAKFRALLIEKGVDLTPPKVVTVDNTQDPAQAPAKP
jgi:lambda family phage portal protein